MAEYFGAGIRAGMVALALVVLPSGSVPAAGQKAPSDRGGAIHALLINGGNQPASNYLSHLQHLQDMVALLRGRGIPAERIHVFSADGENPAADLTMRKPVPRDFWLIEGTALGNRMKPAEQRVNTEWQGVELHAARLDALRQWFAEARNQIAPGDRLLLFVTDHGGRGTKEPGSGTIWLWQEQLTVRELRLLLDQLPQHVQVITVMSQCYSGAFADLMYDRGTQEPSGNTCGFFATSAEDKAYGCYPEGQDQNRIGYAFEFIDALDHQASIAAAHAEVVTADGTPDRPRTTSDAYLLRLVSDEARKRSVGADDLVDTLIAEAWKRRADWEPEIRQLDAIGASVGTFSPRSLRELKAQQENIASLSDQASTYSSRWNTVVLDAKDAVVAEFVAAHPEWRAKLEAKAIEQLTPEARAGLLTQLLEQLHPFARQSSLWPKLERFRDNATHGTETTWRFEVRKAAVDRMRTILVKIAGRQLLGDLNAKPAGQAAASGQTARTAFESLAKCEALDLGAPKASTSTNASRRAAVAFPSLSEDVELLASLQPSSLGVRYAGVPPAMRAAFPSVGTGAHITTVDAGSPAAEAGLLPGDVILGPPDRPFKSPQDILEWTLTSPRDTNLPMKVFRLEGEKNRELEVAVRLKPLSVGRIETGGALRVGTPAPALPSSLASGRGGQLPNLQGQAHVRFFWATWCGPCKAAIPEVMAFAAAKGLPVLAITDEEPATVSKFLKGWTKPFFESIAVDTFRMSFISHGISGTPTIVMVGADGSVRYRQIGYSANEGLRIDGWQWSNR